MIEATGITRRYGRFTAVRDLDLEVPSGVVCGLLGPNGAGKTTTIRMITGMLPPDAGQLRVIGRSMPAERREALARIGYLPESAPSNPEMRVVEYLRFRARLLGLSRRARESSVAESLAACDLLGVERRLVGQLSKGFRQRVGLAAALLGDPKLLVLDEPTVGLDPRQLRDFRSLVRRLADRRTVLLSSHIMQEIEAVADRVVLMHQGRKLADDTVEAFRLGGENGGRTVIRVARDERPDAGDLLMATLRPLLGSEGVHSDVHSGVHSGVHSEPTISENRIELVVPGGDRTEAVGRLLAPTPLVVLELRYERPDVESVFLDLLERNSPDRGGRFEGANQ